MLITRARSVRNVGKVPFKFRFDVLVETVDKIAASGDVVVVWERSSSKVNATKPAKIDRTTRKAMFGSEKIESEVTLFKTQPSEKKFQEKVVKLAVKTNGIDGKTLGKIHLNLADYAEVPSGMKRISAELTNGSTIIATIQSQFLSMGKGTPGRGGGRSDTSNGSIDEEMDDLDAAPKKIMYDGEETPSSFLKNKLKINRAGSRSRMIGRSDKRSRSTDEENGGDVANVEGGAEKLKKENARLKKQLEETERSKGDGKLAEENKALKREVKDLKNALAREPVYSDVVKELKEAKMALALTHMEKEKLALELMKYERGEVKPRSCRC